MEYGIVSAPGHLFERDGPPFARFTRRLKDARSIFREVPYFVVALQTFNSFFTI